MKIILVKIALLASFIVPINANAWFLTDLVESLTTTTTASGEVTIEMLQLFSALADDIGEMADRILVMADKILVMSDNILIMADKIVATEQLMANLVTDVASIKLAVESDNAGLPTVIISSLNTTPLSTLQAPLIGMNVVASEYLVYVSSSMTMTSNTISVLVHNDAELQAVWSNLVALAVNNQIFIAVKTIDANVISSLSNVLTYSVY